MYFPRNVVPDKMGRFSPNERKTRIGTMAAFIIHEEAKRMKKCHDSSARRAIWNFKHSYLLVSWCCGFRCGRRRCMRWPRVSAQTLYRRVTYGCESPRRLINKSLSKHARASKYAAINKNRLSQLPWLLICRIGESKRCGKKETASDASTRPRFVIPQSVLFRVSARRTTHCAEFRWREKESVFPASRAGHRAIVSVTTITGGGGRGVAPAENLKLKSLLNFALHGERPRESAIRMAWNWVSLRPNLMLNED